MLPYPLNGVKVALSKSMNPGRCQLLLLIQLVYHSGLPVVVIIVLTLAVNVAKKLQLYCGTDAQYTYYRPLATNSRHYSDQAGMIYGLGNENWITFISRGNILRKFPMHKNASSADQPRLC